MQCLHVWQCALLLYLSDTGAAGSVATTNTIKGSTCCMKCYLYKNADVCYKRIQVLIDTKLIKVACQSTAYFYTIQPKYFMCK